MHPHEPEREARARHVVVAIAHVAVGLDMRASVFTEIERVFPRLWYRHDATVARLERLWSTQDPNGLPGSASGAVSEVSFVSHPIIQTNAPDVINTSNALLTCPPCCNGGGECRRFQAYLLQKPCRVRRGAENTGNRSPGPEASIRWIRPSYPFREVTWKTPQCEVGHPEYA